MKTSRDEIIREILSHRAELEKLGVKSLSLFGSAARDEMNADSDVDVLVETSRPLGWDIFDIESYLTQLLRRRVDLATPKALHPRLKPKIMRDLRHVI